MDDVSVRVFAGDFINHDNMKEYLTYVGLLIDARVLILEWEFKRIHDYLGELDPDIRKEYEKDLRRMWQSICDVPETDYDDSGTGPVYEAFDEMWNEMCDKEFEMRYELLDMIDPDESELRRINECRSMAGTIQSEMNGDVDTIKLTNSYVGGWESYLKMRTTEAYKNGSRNPFVMELMAKYNL